MKSSECKQNVTVIPSPDFQKAFKGVLPVSSICEGEKKASSETRACISICHQNDYEKFPGMCKLTRQMKENQSL